MKNELDCRGLGCPAPVLKIRDALIAEESDVITVLVDNEAAWQNVSRFLEHNDFHVSTERVGADFRVIGTKKAVPNFPAMTDAAPVAKKRESGLKKILVMVTSEHMGHGDNGLGDMLQFNFLKTLKEIGPDLWRVVFVNSGVKFTAEGSEAVPVLQELAGSGVQIMACGACLAYFHLLDKVQVGEITNMLD
ncbi:MAG: sulfurtransferase-like selenium metabolism protein YedF, partial [Desulfuromonadaceae bacterium]|nr:sulfurtransferase-like selenium metabolism protein YedF [Desulfuromonadaceae bacterium]